MKRNFSISFVFLLIPMFLFSQGQKTIDRNNVSSQTVYEYFIAEGLSTPVVEKIESFDRSGNTIELKIFNKEGQIKSWMKYRYNEDDDVIEEITLNSKGKQEARIVFKYSAELLIEKEYYDQKDRLVKKKEYKYEYYPDEE